MIEVWEGAASTDSAADSRVKEELSESESVFSLCSSEFEIQMIQLFELQTELSTSTLHTDILNYRAASI